MKLGTFNDGVDTTGEEIYSFLMIGQSNMAGRGELLESAQIKNDKCFMFRMGRWQKMCEPINPDRPIFGITYSSGACLATSFADCVSNHYDVKVGLIPCADGGTGIDAWKKGEVLYDYAVMMANLAKRSSKIAGIIWHQGETDASNEEKAKAHKQKFIDMITSLKKDIGLEDVPVIIGELAYNYTRNFGDNPKIINKQYHEVASELKNFAVALSEGLELKADGLHFNLKSLREFGLRYFEEYKKLVEKNN